MRCKTKTVYKEPERPEDCSMWSFDGSSTGQADGGNSDVLLKPVALFADPFRKGSAKIALCETVMSDYVPNSTNLRAAAAEALDLVKVGHFSKQKLV